MSKTEAMQTIKAIETHYKGYKFRSRLEARWAVYFDALKLKWLYEDEGFDLSTGERYLPDFYISEGNYFVEIKPDNYNHQNELLHARFVKESGNKLILCIGLPSQLPNKMYHAESLKLLIENKTEGIYTPVFMMNNTKRVIDMHGHIAIGKNFEQEWCWCNLLDGAIAAKSARFEFVEKLT